MSHFLSNHSFFGWAYYRRFFRIFAENFWPLPLLEDAAVQPGTKAS